MDAVQQVGNILTDIVKALQSIGAPSVAIAFAIGGIYHIFGGAEGSRKAKPWYIGGTIGLLVLLGAGAFSTYLAGRMKFGAYVESIMQFAQIHRLK